MLPDFMQGRRNVFRVGAQQNGFIYTKIKKEGQMESFEQFGGAWLPDPVLFSDCL